MKYTLRIYKELQNQYGNTWDIASDMIIYNSVDAFVDDATDEEYSVIATTCYRVERAVAGVDLMRLADRIAEEYRLKNITLDYLKEVSPHKLLDKMLWR